MRTTLFSATAALAVLLAAGCNKPNEAPPPPSEGTPTSASPGGPPGPPGPPPGAARVAAAGDAERGKLIFQNNCVRCHGADGKGKLEDQPDFTDATWQKREEDEELFTAIRDGHEKMPPFKNKLTEVEIRDVLAYVRSFAKP